MNLTIGPIRSDEYVATGQMMVAIYAALAGFPSPTEQAAYYAMLANIGTLQEREQTQVLVARNEHHQVVGAVVFIADTRYYAAKGFSVVTENACGLRLLGVDPSQRGQGIGKALTLACLDQARALQRQQVILHTTAAMQVAWRMYEALGFRRDHDLDFMQEALPVFGFRLLLNDNPAPRSAPN